MTVMIMILYIGYDYFDADCNRIQDSNKLQFLTTLKLGYVKLQNLLFCRNLKKNSASI